MQLALRSSVLCEKASSLNPISCSIREIFHYNVETRLEGKKERKKTKKTPPQVAKTSERRRGKQPAADCVSRAHRGILWSITQKKIFPAERNDAVMGTGNCFRETGEGKGWRLNLVFNPHFAARHGGTLLIYVTNLFTFISICVAAVRQWGSTCCWNRQPSPCHPPLSFPILFFFFAFLFFSGRYLRLKMFREDHGSWMTMFFSTILFLFIFSHIYNLFLLMAGSMR